MFNLLLLFTKSVTNPTRYNLSTLIGLWIILLLGLNQASAQGNLSSFQKVWVCDKQALDESENGNVPDGNLNICPKRTSWEVFSNQLYLEFTPKINRDTMLLYYKTNDVGAGFWGFRGMPKANSLFAKLYHIGENRLAVVYMNKTFVRAIRARINDSEENERLIFPNVLYLNFKKESFCE